MPPQKPKTFDLGMNDPLHQSTSVRKKYTDKLFIIISPTVGVAGGYGLREVLEKIGTSGDLARELSFISSVLTTGATRRAKERIFVAHEKRKTKKAAIRWGKDLKDYQNNNPESSS